MLADVAEELELIAASHADGDHGDGQVGSTKVVVPATGNSCRGDRKKGEAFGLDSGSIFIVI